MRRLTALIILAVASIALAASTAATAHTPQPAPVAVSSPAPSALQLPPFVVPPRSLHPCGSSTRATPSEAVQWATYDAAAEFGVNPAVLFAIARGESGYNPDAANRRSSARGLDQHLGRYWPSRVTAFNRAHPDRPLASASIYDPVSQSRVTAWMLTGGMGRVGRRAWAC